MIMCLLFKYGNMEARWQSESRVLRVAGCYYGSCMALMINITNISES